MQVKSCDKCTGSSSPPKRSKVDIELEKKLKEALGLKDDVSPEEFDLAIKHHLIRRMGQTINLSDDASIENILLALRVKFERENLPGDDNELIDYLCALSLKQTSKFLGIKYNSKIPIRDMFLRVFKAHLKSNM